MHQASDWIAGKVNNIIEEEKQNHLMSQSRKCVSFRLTGT